MSDHLDPDARSLRDERGGESGEPHPTSEPEPQEPWEPRPETPWQPTPPEPWEPEPEKPWEPEPPKPWEPETEKPWEPESPKPWAQERATERERQPPSPWNDAPREPPPWDSAPPAQPPPPPRPPPERTGLNPLVRLGVPQPWRTIIDWIVTIAGAIAIVLAIKAWVVNPYRIPSSSMEPTLHCARPGSLCTAHFSDRVLACRFCYRFSDPHRGQIIVFNVPDKAKEVCGAGGVFVKRIIGLPGEVWQEKNGYVYIDGKRLVEPYIKPERRDFQSYPAKRIPKTNYFMMGDNRQSSCDSRRWGTVPRKNIIGKVFAIYWPPNRLRIM
jgi:signal peptidase I